MASRADQPIGAVHAPSAADILKASGIALIAAAAILVSIVLPAEYGVDPLGTGTALGLTALSQAAVAEPVAPPRGEALAPVQEGRVALYPRGYSIDTREFVLGPYEFIEYKYHLAKDASMLFAWSASNDVLQDFHGDPDGARSDATESYDKKPRRQADGSFTAPFSGVHGWYWENPGSEPLTIKLTTSGFYAVAYQYPMNGPRQQRDVRSANTIASTDN